MSPSWCVLKSLQAKIVLWDYVFGKILILLNVHYGNTSCGVFKGGYKIRKILTKNQHTQRKLLNFEFWSNGERSKIGHHFSNKVI